MRLNDWPMARLLSAALLALVVLSLLPATILNAVTMSNLLVEREKSAVHKVARDVAEGIEAHFEGLLAWGGDFSNRPALRGWLEARDYSDAGRRATWEAEILKPFLERKHLKGLFVASSEGRLILRQGDVSFPVSPLASWRPFVEAVAGSSAVSDMHGGGGRPPSYTILVPIWNPNSRSLVAIIGIEDYQDSLKSLMKRHGRLPGSQGYSELADEQAVRLVHTTDFRLEGVPMAPLPADVEKMYRAESRLLSAPSADLAAATRLTAARDRILQMAGMPASSDFLRQFLPAMGEEGYSVLVPLRTKRWIVATSFPESAITRPVREQLLRNGILLVLTLGVALAMAIGISRALTRPIRELIGVTREQAGGRLSARAPQGGENEIGQLAVSFNLMADRLHAFASSLEQKVQERTEQVSAANAVLSRQKTELQAKTEELQAKTEELQAKTEELQVKAEELQLTTEELQAQTEELQAQAEELQAQTEELQAQTETLQAQADKIEAQRAELETAYQALRQIDDLKAELFSGVSHDLRTPLQVVVGLASMLAEGDPAEVTPEQARYGDRILAACNVLQGLIDDLLELSRVQSGHFKLVRDHVDYYGEIVMRSVEFVRPLADEKGQDLSLALPESPLPDMEIDLERVGRVLANLLGNAIKFTPIGGEIRVTVERREGSVITSVRDTGPGVTPEAQEHLFEAFYRAPGTTAVGTGLGLAISKQIVDAHGGQIGVTSGPGGGATLWFTLPVLDSGPEPSPTEALKKSLA